MKNRTAIVSKRTIQRFLSSENVRMRLVLYIMWFVIVDKQRWLYIRQVYCLNFVKIDEKCLNYKRKCTKSRNKYQKIKKKSQNHNSWDFSNMENYLLV